MQQDMILEGAKRRLVLELKPSKIYLFGSRARGSASPDSDYDCYVVVPSGKERPVRRAQRAYHALRGLDISKDIVVVTDDRFERMKSVVASLEHEVASKGVLLYG